MPPSTLKSDPSDDERVVIIFATLVGTVTALVAISLRVFLRVKLVRSFGWDVGWSLSFLSEVVQTRSDTFLL